MKRAISGGLLDLRQAGLKVIAALPASAAPVWHAAPGSPARFVADLIADETSRLRPGGSPLPLRPWPPELPLHEQDLGLDSLERLTVASELNEALHLRQSGIEDMLLARPSFGDPKNRSYPGDGSFGGGVGRLI